VPLSDAIGPPPARRGSAAAVASPSWPTGGWLKLARVGDRTSILAQATEHFHEHGYAVVPGYLSEDDLEPAQAELGLMFPTAEEYHAGADPDRNSRFASGEFAGIDLFPYSSVEWSLLGVSPPIVALAQALLGTAAVRLYEAHNWAKYSGASDYDQLLHCDYRNHTLLVPSDDPTMAEVEMFIYIHAVPEELGPTHLVSQRHTEDLRIWPPLITREEYAEVYAREVSTAGPAGTVLAYKTDTYHRGTAMRASRGARFSLKASYRTVSDVWFDKLGLTERLSGSWYRFVEHATPEQLELVGFPPRGHRYWTSSTWSDVSRRYPDADLSAFRPH
jgi:ectoine hydroxylase-related dioxygenase (phytanoyl-CoA dioxygenase family)